MFPVNKQMRMMINISITSTTANNIIIFKAIYFEVRSFKEIMKMLMADQGSVCLTN